MRHGSPEAARDKTFETLGTMMIRMASNLNVHKSKWIFTKDVQLEGGDDALAIAIDMIGSG